MSSGRGTVLHKRQNSNDSSKMDKVQAILNRRSSITPTPGSKESVYNVQRRRNTILMHQNMERVTLRDDMNKKMLLSIHEKNS